MTELVIVRGLPASGKSTWARGWVEEDVDNRARVNRDDLREMLHWTYVPGRAEQRVAAARDRIVMGALRSGASVVSDDTNLPSRTVRDLLRLARRAGTRARVVDLTSVPVQECIQRDRARQRSGERSVGEDVILDLYRRFVEGRETPLPVPALPANISQ